MKKLFVPVLCLIYALGLISVRPFAIYADSDNFDSTNYTLVDYVSPNGSEAYINTGYSPKSTTSIISTFSYTSIISGRRLYGGNDASNQYGLGISSSDYYTIRYGNGTSTINTDGKFSTNTIVTFNQSPSVTTATDGTTTYSTSTYTQTNNISRALVIFGLNTSGGIVNKYPTARLYDFKIYENSNLVHHYYPCFRKSDNVVGIYDSISDVFLQSTGGSLSYGSIATTQYTITTSVSPTGSGTVTGGGTYDSGSVITLTATANTGYHFVSWSDNDTSNPRTITVNSNQSYQAVFVQDSTPVTRYTITTSVYPTGSGTVTGGGTYDSGSVITLTATANTGYEFVNWSDNVSTNPRQITVNSDISLTANFQQSVSPSQNYTITTSVSPTGSGTVTGGGTYLSGTVITLTANASNGYVFGSWSDGSTVNPRQIEVTSNASYTAIFTTDLQNNIVIGGNLNIIDYENYVIVTQVDGTITATTNNSYSVTYYNTSGPDHQNLIYEYEIIFNNEYLGYIDVNFHTTSGSSINYTRRVFVNGNSCKINFIVSGSVDFYVLNITTNNLSLKESTVNAIYSGTQESNESVNSFENNNDDLNDISSDVFDLENDFNQNMNDSLDDIDPDFTFDNNFGSKFLYSANFIKDEFDNLTQNNAFGSLLSFSLLLGLGLLIIGKIL